MAVAFSELAKDPELYRIVIQRNKVADIAPMLASIMYSMEVGPHTEVHNDRCETMATDGSRLYWNRAYVQSLTNKQLRAVLLHEGLHVFLRHHLRRGQIDPNVWNVACDYAINIMVVDNGFDLPKDTLLDFKYRGMTAEQIVRSMPKPEDHPTLPSPSDEEGEGEGSGSEQQPSGQPTGHGAGEIWDAVDEEGERLVGTELEAAEEQARRDVIQAEVNAKLREAGQGTFNIEDGVYEDARGASVNWTEELRDLLEDRFPQEVTLDTPNRRLLAHGYFPSTTGVGGGDLIIVTDTSSSTRLDREAYASEIDEMRNQVRPDRTVLIYCDDHIQKGDGQYGGSEFYDVFDAYDEIVVRAKVGGGTEFNPPFKLVERENLNPSALIYFTDGYGTVSSDVCDSVDYPVIWAVSTDHDPSFYGTPFGETVRVTPIG